MKNEETITISKEDYEELISDQKFLQCLQAAGVNDWEGFEIAQENFQDDE